MCSSRRPANVDRFAPEPLHVIGWPLARTARTTLRPMDPFRNNVSVCRYTDPPGQPDESPDNCNWLAEERATRRYVHNLELVHLYHPESDTERPPLFLSAQ